MTFADLDGEVMKEVVARAELLRVIEAEPRTLRELEERLSPSRSTIHRTTNSLIDKGILKKSNETFELTGTGSVVVDAIGDLDDAVTGACHLRPFLNTASPTNVDIPVQHFRDAELTQPRPHQAHVAVNRITELIENSGSLRMLSSIISPFYVDVAHREILDGMEITIIFDEQIIETIASEYQQEASEALETGRFDVYVAGDVPFELFLFDDRMGMAAHDENALARGFVETDATDAIEWATDLYERYRSEAMHADLG